MSIANASLQGAALYAQDRLSEGNTQAAMIASPVIAPPLIDNATSAVLSIAAGDYAGAIMHGIPALFGLAGVVAAIITPQQQKGPTDEQIQQAIAIMPRDQRIRLLSIADDNTASQPVQTIKSL